MEIIMKYLNRAHLYNVYHSDRKLEKRVIYDYDFTHNPLIKVLSNRVSNYKNALDIGCGTGTVCFYLASKGIITTGIDISKRAIDIARINAKQLKIDKMTKFVLDDFSDSKIAEKFDLIICSEVLEHVNDDLKALRKIKNLLKRNGEAFLSVPLKSSFLYRNKLLNKFEVEVGHLRRYDDSDFVRLIKKLNFEVIDVRKNQGVLRDLLFTSTTKSLIVATANKYKIVSEALTFIDKLFFFFGVSNMTVLARKK